jgi:hypothetical protein
MTALLILFLVFLIVFSAYLLFKNNTIKNSHYNKIKKLENIVILLRDKQLLLNEKISILNDYNNNYKKDIKIIGDEMLELQKVFIDIISNKNN